jgi:hypothetical protein
MSNTVCFAFGLFCGAALGVFVIALAMSAGGE